MYREDRSILFLAIPIMLSQIGQFAVQIADNIMVGHLGSEQLAGIAFAGNVYFLIYIFGVGMTLGITPLIGEQYAQSQLQIVAKYFFNSSFLFLIVGLFVSLMQLSMLPLFQYLGQSNEIVRIASQYYIYLAISTLPLILFCVVKQFLEGIGNTSVAMIVTLFSNILNIALNYVFIYGKCGFNELGSSGAGMATLISRIVALIAIVLFVCHKNTYKKYLYWFKKSFFSIKQIRELLSVSIPIAIQITLEGGTFAVTGIMMGWYGAVMLAANQIAIVIANIAFFIVTSIGSATTIKVSHMFGTKDYIAINRIRISSQRISLLFSIIIAAIFIIHRLTLPKIFISESEVIHTTGVFLIFVALYQIPDSYQMVYLSILRGMQDVKATSIVAFFAYIIITIPLGYVIAFTLNFGPNGLWAGYIFGLSFAAITLKLRYNKIIRRNKI